MTAESQPPDGRGAAHSGRTGSSLVVSIHDVAPATRATVTSILRSLATRGVGVCSLLVVPNYHRTGSSLKDAGFCDWLRQLVTEGHEVVIHGYFHQRAARHDESLGDRVATRFYTAGEGEFYDIGYDDALELISRAKEEFERCGLRPRGFIAPAWLLSRDGERAAADVAMDYTTRIATVTDLVSGARCSARSLVYSTRASWRRAVSLGWNALLVAAVRQQPLVRLAVHPPDYDFEAIWRQILRYAGELSRTRVVATYSSWVASQRENALAAL